ncbi:magnesium transporter CorA family protein [Clostridium niameyense]|uniref:Magnesium transporter CorA family protein n=1 Tax=Clostridium niameyense TaxID=1622073 RepID=A0A6M0RCC1_9CLOT|nr:magnesium transporter CorA family protein [Clostridium niameyense]NEZ47340.1 magnesium transporter CorA family protein [Clostridium niameyense]
MISIYKNTEEDKTIKQLDTIEPGAWINIVAPSQDELEFISKEVGIPVEFLKSALDEEETSRIETEENNTLVIVDIPFTEMEDNSLTYDTYPLGIIYTETILITVCLKNSKILTDFMDSKIKSFYTFKRSRFILQILYRIASYYLLYLRQIDKKSLLIEKKLHKSMKNKELILLLSLEKSLVYFSTSLKSNEITLEKMLKLDLIQKYPEDQDVLEDVIIENKQAIEMANIYSNILSGTMDAFASVISNNLNIVMKLLASITIVMSIPNIIFGSFGMNVKGIPFNNTPNAFLITNIITVIICILVIIFLRRKDLL